MRLAIALHLLWKRIEIALCALVIPGLIVESSVANGWAYGGGPVGFLRGFFLELITYVTARQAYIFFAKKHSWFGGTLMAFVSLTLMYVSAMNNLGWVFSGHEMAGLLGSLGKSMPVAFSQGYQLALAICLPLSLGAIALVDLDHFFEHAIEQDHLDNHAMQVDERRMHRNAFQRALRQQKDVLTDGYADIAEDRAQGFIDQARTGNLTFGAGQTVTTEQLPEQQQLPMPAASTATFPNPTVTGTVWPVDVQPQGQWTVPGQQWSVPNP